MPNIGNLTETTYNSTSQIAGGQGGDSSVPLLASDSSQPNRWKFFSYLIIVGISCLLLLLACDVVFEDYHHDYAWKLAKYSSEIEKANPRSGPATERPKSVESLDFPHKVIAYMGHPSMALNGVYRFLRLLLLAIVTACILEIVLTVLKFINLPVFTGKDLSERLGKEKEQGAKAQKAGESIPVQSLVSMFGRSQVVTTGLVTALAGTAVIAPEVAQQTAATVQAVGQNNTSPKNLTQVGGTPDLQRAKLTSALAELELKLEKLSQETDLTLMRTGLTNIVSTLGALQSALRQVPGDLSRLPEIENKLRDLQTEAHALSKKLDVIKTTAESTDKSLGSLVPELKKANSGLANTPSIVGKLVNEAQAKSANSIASAQTKIEEAVSVAQNKTDVAIANAESKSEKAIADVGEKLTLAVATTRESLSEAQKTTDKRAAALLRYSREVEDKGFFDFIDDEGKAGRVKVIDEALPGEPPRPRAKPRSRMSFISNAQSE